MKNTLFITVAASLLCFLCISVWIKAGRSDLDCQDFALKSVTKLGGDQTIRTAVIHEGEDSNNVLSLLCHSRRESVVFSPTYQVHVEYKHQRTDLMVNGDHFMLNGITYRMRGDLDVLLSKNF